MIPSSSEMKALRTRCMVEMTSSWTIGCGSTPAAMFEMHEMPSPSGPMWRGGVASRTGGHADRVAAHLPEEPDFRRRLVAGPVYRGVNPVRHGHAPGTRGL